MFKALGSIWSKEPARVVGAVGSFLALLVVFGVHISTTQMSAVIAFVVACVPAAAAEVTRSQVSPVSSPPPPASPYRTAPSEPSTPVKAPRMPPLHLLLGLFLVALPLIHLACSAAAWELARDASGVVCAVAIQSTNPELAPICAGIDEIEAVIAELVTEHTAEAGAAAGPYKPSQDEIYERLRTRRAAGK